LTEEDLSGLRRAAAFMGQMAGAVTDPIPPVAMRTAAMNEQKAALARPRRLARPNQVMDPAARYRHELRLAGAGNGPPEPIRGRRTDREEIGWYGFAAQRGCTHIIASALPLIGQHHIGRRTLLIP